MRESIWGYAILVLGIMSIMIIWFFSDVTNLDQQNYNLIKESVENAMIDAIDLATYRNTAEVKIDEEKFVENFVRRFAENASLARQYKIEIYHVNEIPPKVSLKISSKKSTNIFTSGEEVTFDMVNNIDAILETKYKN